jgi:hypothetical protein
MTPRTFFTILLKILGIYLVLDTAIVIPSFIFSAISTFCYPGNDTALTIGITALVLALTAGTFYFILRYCVLKPEWIIDKLKLDQGFTEEKFELNVHRSTVLTIAVVVTGSLILVEAIPLLCRDIFDYIAFMKTAGRAGGQSYHWSGFAIEFVKILIGYLMITNSRAVVNFIERQRKA